MSEEIGTLLELVTAGEWGNNQGTQGGVDTGVIRSANFTKDHQFNTKEIVVRSIEERKRQKKLLRNGDILIEKSGGSPDQPVGRVLFYDLKGEHTCSNFISILRPSQHVEAKFLYYSLCNLYEKGVVKNYQQQTTGIINLQLGEYLRESIYLPPLPEQKKIAEILSGIDRQIDLMRCQESKSDELLRAMLHAVFSEPDLSPYSDTSNSLAELEEQGKISLGRGDIISKIDIRERPGRYPIYSSSGKGDGKFGEYGEYMFDEELITWSIDGGGRLFHRSRHKFSVTNVCGYLRNMDNSIDYGYLHSSLEYQHGNIKFDYSHKAHPSVIRKLYRVALPPIERQRQLASATGSVKQQRDAITSKIHALTTLKSAISSDLLSGRKRVSV